MSVPLHAPLPDLDLLDRYLAGEGTPPERAEIEVWLKENPANGERLRALRTLGEVRRDGSHDGFDADRAWRKVVRAETTSRTTSISTALPGVHRAAPDNYTRRFGYLASRTVWYVAAVLVTGAVGLFTGLHSGRSRIGGGAGNGGDGVITYATPRGQRANITLPDGNVVLLNVASTLYVPVNYTAGNHVLRLNGEALFTVTHRAGTPFGVTVGSTTVRVLGTTFAVRRYATDTAITVSVREGKVSVRSVILAAGQQVDVGGAGTMFVRPADRNRFGFAAGVLWVDGLRLSDAIPELNRWYDVDIRLHDRRLAERRLEGEYKAGSVAELQEILAGTFGVRVVREGRVLTLYSR